MRSYWFLVALVMIAVGSEFARAQPTPRRCDPARAAEFDFWLGSWTIVQSIAQPGSAWRTFPARATVTKELGGCGLLERWQGEVLFPWEGMTTPEPLDAVSLRSVNATGQWTIYWIDSRVGVFGPPYRGRFEGTVGTFDATLEPPPGSADGARFFGRITFDRGTRDVVRWELAVSSDRSTWRPIWRMRMTRPIR